MRKNTPASFWRRVYQPARDECWPWLGKTIVNGYGKVRYHGKLFSAHRLAWILAHGPIADDDSWHGTVVMHSCDNRLCCNPEHLSLGTQANNIADMESKGRRVSKGRRGAAHHFAKLTEQQVIDIHMLLNRGLKRKEIALQFGVSRDLISQIRVGIKWRYVYEALLEGEKSCQS